MAGGGGWLTGEGQVGGGGGRLNRCCYRGIGNGAKVRDVYTDIFYWSRSCNPQFRPAWVWRQTIMKRGNIVKTEKIDKKELAALSEDEICEIIETTIEDLGLLTRAFEVIETACGGPDKSKSPVELKSEKVTLH